MEAPTTSLLPFLTPQLRVSSFLLPPYPEQPQDPSSPQPSLGAKPQEQGGPGVMGAGSDAATGGKYSNRKALIFQSPLFHSYKLKRKKKQNPKEKPVYYKISVQRQRLNPAKAPSSSRGTWGGSRFEP